MHEIQNMWEAFGCQTKTWKDVAKNKLTTTLKFYSSKRSLRS